MAGPYARGYAGCVAGCRGAAFSVSSVPSVASVRYFALKPDLIQASLFTPSGGVVCSGG